jgi:lipooligosaccharide transport system ATP-binding protein
VNEILKPLTSASTPEPLVVARNLTKRFGSLTAVDDIAFDIMPGEVVGFLGPNGAGKTTTIRMLNCTSPLTAGSLTVFGLDVMTGDRSIKAQIGVVPQDNNYDPDLKVMQNLLTYARYFRLDKRVAAQRARELLEFVQLAEKANEHIDALSGGMKRRLVLARSLINKPRLLIADEPTTGLDPQARRLIWQRFRELRHSGVTIIITTHYMDEAEQICDRLLVMNEAKIIAEGTPAALIQEHAGQEVLEVVPEDPSSPELAPVLAGCSYHQQIGDKFEIFTSDCPDLLQMIRSRVRLTSYAVRRATLEDVFIRLTGRELRD